MNPVTNEDLIFFENQGYLLVPNLLSPEEISYYDHVYNSFLNNEIANMKYRSDLSGNSDGKTELITQIMVPSRQLPELLEKSLHHKTLELAKALLGPDMELDFDMLINKAPNTKAITPWHQDAAYWIDLPDRRALSCWVAVDESTKENGCMWYTPASHKQGILPHSQVGNKGALICEGSEENSVCIPIQPGSCIVHHGATLHYSRGNSTEQQRRAFITNYRPAAMIALEREQGEDHTGEREVK